MPKTSVERNSFIKGLITEASPLTFPENASLDEVNFQLNRDGSRQRRLGLDYETGYSKISLALSSAVLAGCAISSFVWKNINNESTVGLSVVQVGSKLWFFDLLESAHSASIKNGGVAVDLNSLYGVSNSSELQFAAVNGILVVTCISCKPIKVEYDSDADSITTSQLNLKIRDLVGVEDVNEVDVRPTTYSVNHHYNLLNQGWTDGAITQHFNQGGSYPSNADILHLGKNAISGDFQTGTLWQQFFGNTPAPKGKFIIDAFKRGQSRSSKSGLTLSGEEERGKPTVCAAFAGRLFYSGIKGNVRNKDDESMNFTGSLLYTQLVDNNKKLEYCYQEADPTSEHVSDLVATDGGVVDIIDAKNILKLIARETSLVVIAENGVWEISGPDGIFKADDYSISQVTTVGAVNAQSILDVEGTIMYWADSGIMQLSPDQVSGKLSANNLTETTIQSFYIDISSVSKLYCVGNYDSGNRTVSWLYNSSNSYDGTSFVSKYNRELRYDLVLGAFYYYNLSTLEDQVYVAGYLPTDMFQNVDVNNYVYSSSDNVLSSAEDVILTERARGVNTTKTKYITIINTTSVKMTFSAYTRDDFYDWKTEDGVGEDSSGYLITGYELFNDSQRNKFLNYLTTHFIRTEDGFTDDGIGNLTPTHPSSCTVQVRWGWANSAAGGKWSSSFQAYRPRRAYVPLSEYDDYDTGELVITTKNKIRGTGRSLSIKFSTTAGHEMHILGWAYNAEGGSYV